MDFHEMTESEGGSHKDERLSRSQVEEKSTEIEFGIL